MAVNALMAYSHMTDPVDTRTRFWSDPTRWPQDAGGFIFAAKALQKLGRRLLPSEWSDHSPLTEYIGELPEIGDGVVTVGQIHQHPVRCRYVLEIGDRHVDIAI